MLQRKVRKNYQNLPAEAKNKEREYAHNQYRKLFIENKLSEKEKTKNVNVHPIYIIILPKKKRQKVQMCT